MLRCTACGTENPVHARFCLNCAAPLAAADPASRREVRKVVTILFSDLSGSTALGERLDPERLRNAMGTYFRAMQSVVERHGGRVEKFIGDAIMAVFGIPQVHEDDALRAVRAAVEMRKTLEELGPRLGLGTEVVLTARMGINSGEVVAGDPAHGQTLVTGDAVNVAARLGRPPGRPRSSSASQPGGWYATRCVRSPRTPSWRRARQSRLPPGAW